MNKNSLALVFLGLVAVIALVGLILLGNIRLSGDFVAEEDLSVSDLTGEASWGRAPPKKCGVSSFRVMEGCSMGRGKVMGYKSAFWKCYVGAPITQSSSCQFSFDWKKMADAYCRNACG